ncbi:hypothetical protein A2973_00695 [Candidatus Gottesmanbacteria bacterium RIFCSPLOWO2_01_FULL_49_10]|uniref:Uncharacterized protein n=1 Tax=Candidatus Gottesmanbacteria bacterium RIFCSPLOWO2_01_FULL_49_10 TaxID=1798396 RepID=A0A1F6AWP0_9BACT|nr:MAG: hypothetical protein UY10_C0002G0004 [Microgenomates group bacterium GW2011_GWA2_47_8]OGG29104.1 MAG: hypothetical protein A2973_00695 [Candidatus Gottesmanbacteria bacterium RIFCSPLOWO2_01_FULL_49_10]
MNLLKVKLTSIQEWTGVKFLAIAGVLFVLFKLLSVVPYLNVFFMNPIVQVIVPYVIIINIFKPQISYSLWASLALIVTAILAVLIGKNSVADLIGVAVYVLLWMSLAQLLVQKWRTRQSNRPLS